MALTDKLTAIGDAIREKTGGTEKITLDQMPTEIRSITTAGEIQELNITSNGTYNAPDGVDGYNPITVDVQPNLETLSVTANGNYTPTETDGYSSVSVNVQPSLTTLSVTENGTYTASDSGVDGYSSVTVDVPSSGELPDELVHYTGDCSYKFSYNSWNWVIEKYGSLITFDNVENIEGLFYMNKNIQTIPIQLNFNSNTSINCYQMFKYCEKLKQIPDINNLKTNNIHHLFGFCTNLRYLPNFVNYNFSELEDCGCVFDSCYSLRSIPQSLLQNIYNTTTSSYTEKQFYNQFFGCYVLDEIIGLNPNTGVKAENLFKSTFGNCNRVKDIIFKTNDDGTAITVSWKSQVIDLSWQIGYGINDNRILDYNTGITIDKKVTDDASYQLLKNDPDWYTFDYDYSRYNHDSAVRTINSLPDTSSYLATAGGTNTIKFKGASGKKTDGGAINTLTEEQIAVATAKGWTVSLA